MVMTVSSILYIEESLDKEEGGSTAAAGSTNSSAVGSPEVGGLDAPIKDSTQEAQLSYSLPKKGGTYRSYNMYELRCEKIL